MLNFKKIELEDINKVNSIFYKQKDNSCQISFNAMFTTQKKYGTIYAIKDDTVFVKRQNKCDDKFNIYLMPISENCIIKKSDIDEIIEDAHSENKLVRFETITEDSMNLLKEFYNDKFTFTECRDYFEYIYSYDTLANLEGAKLSSKRYDIKTFLRDYGDGLEERPIKISDIEDIKKFQEKWLSERVSNEYVEALINENDVINISLDNYKELGFVGILIKYKKEIIGYAFGFKLTEEAFDVYIEKGDMNFKDVYKLLNRDLVRMCCRNYKYINREEDVGLESLRTAKLSYMPTILMKKFIATENSSLREA